MPGQALAAHDLSPLIHPHRVEYAFCDVDPEDAHLVLHWTRLLGSMSSLIFNALWLVETDPHRGGSIA